MNSDDVEIRTGRMAAADPANGSRAGGAYRGEQPGASMYCRALPAIAAMGGAAAFGAAALSLAMLGLGVPFVLAALVGGLWAGVLLYTLGRWALARARRREVRQAAGRASLRHELRGALQPALMMSDRLLKHEDPAVRRAGEAVVRSVERATALIVQDKPEEGK